MFFSPREKRDEAAEARKKFLSYEGDHVTLLNLWKAYRSDEARQQERAWCEENFVNVRALQHVSVGAVSSVVTFVADTRA